MFGSWPLDLPEQPAARTWRFPRVSAKAARSVLSLLADIAQIAPFVVLLLAVVARFLGFL